MRRLPALLALFLAAAAPAALAQTGPAPANEERLTPRALPTPAAPKLTPLLPPGTKGADVPKPAAAMLPPPIVAPPLSPVAVPGAPPPPPPLRPLPPAAEAPTAAPLPAASPPVGQSAPLPPRKPGAAAPPAFIASVPPPVTAPAPPASSTVTAVRPPPEAPAAPPAPPAPPATAAAKDAGKEKGGEKGRGRTAWAKDDVYVRATPDRDGKVLDALLPGEKVEVLPETVDRWSRVARNGKVLGYVASSFLLDKPPAGRSASSAGSGGASDDDGCALPPDIPSGRRVSLAEGSRARILADANLRDAPGCRGRVLDVLEEGETVTVSAEQNGWYRVSRNGRTLGYVSGALLDKAR